MLMPIRGLMANWWPNDGTRETKGNILENADVKKRIDGPMMGGQREAFSGMLMPCEDRAGEEGRKEGSRLHGMVHAWTPGEKSLLRWWDVGKPTREAFLRMQLLASTTSRRESILQIAEGGINAVERLMGS
jgi:hypothetical protein